MRTELMLTTRNNKELLAKNKGLSELQVSADSLSATDNSRSGTCSEINALFVIPIPFIHSVLPTFLLLTRKGKRANTYTKLDDFVLIKSYRGNGRLWNGLCCNAVNHSFQMRIYQNTVCQNSSSSRKQSRNLTVGSNLKK